MYCKSRGLSRAFAEILRLNIERAIEYNVYSVRIFLFFLSQLILRITINLLLKKNITRYLLISDISISVMWFLYAFTPLVTN